MHGWLYGKELIYFMANISANKISLPQGQSYTEGSHLCIQTSLNGKGFQMNSLA